MESKAQDEIKARVGRIVRRFREEAGLTLDGLATNAGISRGFLWAVELGQKSASLETLEKLATALDVEVHDFLGPKRGAGQRANPRKAAATTPLWLARRIQALADGAPAAEITRFDRIATDFFAPYRRGARRGKPDPRR